MPKHKTLPTPVKVERFINRDLSWLDFNYRVLSEALDARNLLLDRVKFLAIYSSNMDEFYMKRVGYLRERGVEKPNSRGPDGYTPSEVLQLAKTKLYAAAKDAIDLWTEQLMPALRNEGIFVCGYAELPEELRKQADAHFASQVFPVLTPLAVDPGHPFPFISNLSLSIGVLMRQPGLEDNLFARIKVPQLFSRWVKLELGKALYYVPLESLIAAHLGQLFPGMEVLESRAFRVTRNAEVQAEMDEDPEDILEVVQEQLRARRFADTVRVQVPVGMSREMRLALIEGLEASEEEFIEYPVFLGFADLMGLANAPRPELRCVPWEPVTAPALRDEDADIFSLIRQGDILVHHPYESFDSSVERFILSAVDDPAVLAIKMTLYRTSRDSPFVTALARAAESGKQVAVLVELKARFDEERNIQWAQKLEKAGAHVVYGVLGLKTHTKTALVVRREADKLRCYGHISTGNYNSRTAQLYTDLGMLTCREDICADMIDLFAFLTGRSLKTDYRRLLVAPVNMRSEFVRMIRQEASNAQAGKPARIVAKMNQLEDPEVIEELYRAGAAGVPIDLIVRGFCCLRAGVPKLSENIRVISILGRLLEHSRVFKFENGGKPLYYMGSGDWMSRNLSHRVEAAVPVDDPRLQERIGATLELYLIDNRQAWDLQPDGTWVQRYPVAGEKERASQCELMQMHQAGMGL